ncbi:Gfo/Idh/MocA family oxidoreductase [Diaminobutyricibacter tongyongensis]|uniref:Gfo/Idh/MocA family oxidoreductase n=1 Tax=Leifsonia tongyongensis TaxID=1268043 RepID=A0A6L9XWG2_9MICO|nr:Gfo/Idh/MocA family oxidoreductase [Diaminobutyricibacter tongyongensis]NEN05348.1 Gfo/Idh/MocA family oxidoreductase [Diaminobutyricibacter tongyongensis]
MNSVRIGVLGAAQIVNLAMIKPASATSGVDVVALAARELPRARKVTNRHGIPKAYGSYSELLADSEIDAVYIPLPPSLHGEWTAAALDAGKHVLIEKPFTANGDEAARVVSKATQSGLVVMEAFHSAFHPLVDDLRGILASGTIGTPIGASGVFSVPIPPGKSTRWNESLGGGALMDVGCYPIRMMQSVFGSTPHVLSANALKSEGIDRAMVATLQFPNGPRAIIHASIWSPLFKLPRLTITGTEGQLSVSSPYHPQFGSTIRIRSSAGRMKRRVSKASTYDLQLAAFRDAIRLGKPLKSGLNDSLAMMRVIDEIYLKAGMNRREPFEIDYQQKLRGGQNT